jgi:hypothetical protein
MLMSRVMCFGLLSAEGLEDELSKQILAGGHPPSGESSKLEFKGASKNTFLLNYNTGYLINN